MPILKPSRHFEGSDFEQSALKGTDLKRVVEEIVGEVLWISDTQGFCDCPGAHLHTTKDAQKDCKLYLEPIPTLSCFHSSCGVTVEETNITLRKLAREPAGTASQGNKKLTEEEEIRIAQVRTMEALRRRAATSRHRILRDYSWPYDKIRADSRNPLPPDPATHWREVLNLFNPEDVIWVGSIYDSGKPEHEGHFCTREKWLSASEAPAQFTCPSTFKASSYSRSNENVVRRPFLVVESDEMDKDTIGAVFRWMREKAGLKLRAIVDTSGKSLHGWFDFPTAPEMDDLRIILPELGCDPKMFTASQPCRLPGALRDGQHQKLIFLNKGGAA